ncbi:tumor necrosis factor ligand superfamily member 18 [Callospermophilus lateralis]
MALRVYMNEKLRFSLGLMPGVLSEKRILSHMENMPLSYPGPQGAQRWSYKQWLLCSAILLTVCSFSALILPFLPLKSFLCWFLVLRPLNMAVSWCSSPSALPDLTVSHNFTTDSNKLKIPSFWVAKSNQQAATDSCQAKFGPLPSKWQMVPPEPSCMNKTSDWKLTILKNGLYLIYGQVVFDTTYKGVAPFEVQLRKNKDALQTLTDNFKIQTVGGAYELHTGDTIGLIFNSEDQILKSNTYWGIVLVANLQFNS